jgi:hypothetical protein
MLVQKFDKVARQKSINSGTASSALPTRNVRRIRDCLGTSIAGFKSYDRVKGLYSSRGVEKTLSRCAAAVLRAWI